MYGSRNDAQKFFKNSSKPSASSCRDERGNLVTDAQRVLRLWRHYFSTVLRGESDINAASREDSEPAPIDDYGVEIPPPNHNEVRVVIQRLKNNEAAGSDGLPAELFKAGGDELVRSMFKNLFFLNREIFINLYN